jgi:hypothetical protein
MYESRRSHADRAQGLGSSIPAFVSLLILHEPSLATAGNISGADIYQPLGRHVLMHHAVEITIRPFSGVLVYDLFLGDGPLNPARC